MSEHEGLERARRLMIRYRLLKILDAGGSLPVGEGLIKQILVDADLAASQSDVRRAMQYLADKSYIEIKKGSQYWDARLLPVGVDYLDDHSVVDSGIARPESI